MFALAITVDVSAMEVCLFQFTSEALSVNSVWALLTMKEKRFTLASDRCDILSKLNNCKKQPKNCPKNRL